MAFRPIIFSPLAPQATSGAKATISGTPSVGSVLTASAAGLTSPTYQWQRDGLAISGATGATYTVATADAGHTLTCIVTGSLKSSGYAIPTGATPTKALLFGGQPLLFGGQNLLY